MFLLCIAYWCVSLCCSSNLLWYVKIATPTALSASALRPGICQSVAKLLYRSVRTCIICAGTRLCFSPCKLATIHASVQKVNCAGCKVGPSVSNRSKCNNDRSTDGSHPYPVGLTVGKHKSVHCSSIHVFNPFSVFSTVPPHVIFNLTLLLSVLNPSSMSAALARSHQGRSCIGNEDR